MNPAAILEERKVDAWYVIRANIKCEEKAEDHLRRAGFTPYLPRARREWFDRRRKVWRDLSFPLMPRYLFVGVPRETNWLALRACQGVEAVLGIGLHPEPIEPGLVAALSISEDALEFDTTRAAMIARGEIGKTERETVAKRYLPGKHYRVTQGPFAQFVAEVSSIKGNGIIEAVVSVFGRLTPIQLNQKSLDPETLDRESEAA